MMKLHSTCLSSISYALASVLPSKRTKWERRDSTTLPLWKAYFRSKQYTEIHTPRSLVHLPATLFASGFNTTASTIGTSLLAIITHLEVLYYA